MDAKKIYPIKVDGFRTAKALIDEYKTAEESTDTVPTEAKRKLHETQTSFFGKLFDGIWQALADNFKTITKLQFHKPILGINDTEYEVSCEKEDTKRFFRLSRRNDETSMPKLLSLQTEILPTNSVLKDSKDLVHYLQIKDSDESKPSQTIFWIKENTILSSDSEGKYRLEPTVEDIKTAPKKVKLKEQHHQPRKAGTRIEDQALNDDDLPANPDGVETNSDVIDELIAQERI